MCENGSIRNMSLPKENSQTLVSDEVPQINMNTLVNEKKVLTFENEKHSSQLPYFEIDIAVIPETANDDMKNVSIVGLKDSGSTDTVINYDLLQCLPGYSRSKLKHFEKIYPIHTAANTVDSSAVAVGEIPLLLTFTTIDGEALTFKHQVKVCKNISKDLFIGQDILDSDRKLYEDRRFVYFCDDSNVVHRVPVTHIENQRCKSVANAILDELIEIEPNSHVMVDVEFMVARRGLYHLEPYKLAEGAVVPEMSVSVKEPYERSLIIVGNLSSEPFHIDPGQSIGKLERIEFFQYVNSNFTDTNDCFTEANWLTVDEICTGEFHADRGVVEINHGRVSAQMDYEQHGANDMEESNRTNRASTVEELIMEDKYLTVNEKRDAVEEYRKNGFHPLPASTLVDRNSGQILEESREIRASRSGSSTGGSGFARIRGHVKSKI